MKLGLTGGIGCGKSTVVRFFGAAGWATVESDKIVQDMLNQDPEVHLALRQRWGDSVFTSDGGVDRAAIASRVFAGADELHWLEDLLHPRVRRTWQQALASRPDANWVVEIPLIFEKRLETAFDLTVCVASPAAVADQRMADRGYTEAAVEQRRQRQMRIEDKLRLADYVITNAGSLEFLEKQTMRLIEQISGT